MSGELRGGSGSGNTLYANILNASAQRWNGSAFETFNAANYSTYTVTLTEQGNSGIYVGNFPPTITTPARYDVVYYLQDGGSPANGDHLAGTQVLDWDGAAVTTTPDVIPGAMSGTTWLAYVLRALKRTDKNTEVFDATKDKIDDIRSRLVMPDDETEIQTTDTITVLGDYQLDLETDFGMLIGQVFVLGTQNQGWALRQIDKQEFDEKYSVFGSGTAVRGIPKEFCIFGGKIYIGPTPDLTTYIYKINYTQDELAEYSASSLSVPFTDRYRQILRWGVLSDVYGDVLKNDDQAAKFGTLYENGLKKIQRRNDRNRSGVLQVRYQGF